jgi:membrane fusion protein, multidrug efflux system
MAQTIDTFEEKLQTSPIAAHDMRQPPEPRPNRVSRPRRVPRSALFVFPMIALPVLFSWWLYARRFESTDDAQIDGHLNAISARISGTVLYITPKVENNQYVEAGTLLVELDPNDYQAALDRAKADLLTREAQARSAGVNVPITDTSAFSRLRLAEAAREEAAASVDAEEANLVAAQHKVQQDEALYSRAERDRIRYQAPVEKREISRSEYDARETESVAAAQALESDRAAVASIQQKIAQGRSLIAERAGTGAGGANGPSTVGRCASQVAVERRRGGASQSGCAHRGTESGYTKIYAPVSGVIGRKTVGSARGFSRDKVYLPSFPSTMSGSPQISRKPSLSTCARVNP